MLCLILKSDVDWLEMMCVSGLKWEDRREEINKVLESKVAPSRDEEGKEYVWIQTPDNWVSFFVELGVLWISRCLGNQARTTVHPLDFTELWLECQRALQRRNDLIGVPVSEGSVHGCVAPWTWTESIMVEAAHVGTVDITVKGKQGQQKGVKV